MKSTTLIELSPSDIKNLMKEAIAEHEKEKSKVDAYAKTYSINQAKNILGRSHTKIKQLISEGLLDTTADQRRIPEWSINEYLQLKK